MPSPHARAKALCTQLSAAGFAPRVMDLDDHWSVETAVPSELSDGSWQQLLALLEEADWFGLVDSSAHGRTAWAAIGKEDAPESACVADRGQHRQP